MQRLRDVLTLPPRASAGHRKRASLDLLWTRRHVEVRGPLLSRSVFGSGEVERLWVTRALYTPPRAWWQLGRGPIEHWLHVHWSARRNRQPVTLGARVSDPDALDGLPWLAADACVPCLEDDLRALIPCLRLLGGVPRATWPDDCWEPPAQPLPRRFPDAATAEADARRDAAARAAANPDAHDPTDGAPAPIMLRDQPFWSLPDALDAAAPNDTLRLFAADYLLQAPLTLTKPVRLIGEGAAHTRLIGMSAPCVLRLEGRADFSLKGLSLVVLQDDPADVLQAAAGARLDLEACHLIGGVADPSADPHDTSPLGCGARLESGVTGSIRSCRFLDNARHGVLLDDDAAVELLRNRAERSALDGIHAASLSHPLLTANTTRHNARHGLAILSSAPLLAPITQHQLSHNRGCGAFVAVPPDANTPKTPTHPTPPPISFIDCACEHNGASGLHVTAGAVVEVTRLLTSDNRADGVRAHDRAHLTLSASRTLRSGRHGVHVSGSARADLHQHQSAHNAAHGCFARDAATLHLSDALLTHNAACGVCAQDLAALSLRGGCALESNAADGLRALTSPQSGPADLSGSCRAEMNGGYGFVLRAARVQGAVASQNALGGFLIDAPAQDTPQDTPQDPTQDSAEAPRALLSKVEAHQHEGGPGLRVLGAARVEASVSSANRWGVVAEGAARLTLEGCDLTRSAADGLRACGAAQVTLAGTRCHRNGGAGAAASEDADLTWRAGDASSNAACGVQALDRARIDLSDVEIIQNRACGARAEGASRLTLRGGRLDDNLGPGLVACDDARADVADCHVTQHHAEGARFEGRAQGTLQRARLTHNRGDGLRCGDAAQVTALRCDLSYNALDGAALDGGARLLLQATTAAYNDRHGLSVAAQASLQAEGGHLLANRACGLDASDSAKLKLVEVSALENMGDGLCLRDQAAAAIAQGVLDGNQGHGLRLRDRAQGTLDAASASHNGGNGADVDDAATLRADRLKADGNQGHGLGVFGGAHLSASAFSASANQRHGLIIGDRAEAKGRHLDATRNGGDGFSLQSATALALSALRAHANQGCGLRVSAAARLEDVSTAENMGAAGLVLSSGASSVSGARSQRDRVGVLITHDAAPTLEGVTVEGCAEAGVCLTDRSRARLSQVTVTGCKRHGVLINREAQAHLNTLRCALNHLDGLHLCDAATAQVIGFSAESNTLVALCLRDAAALTLDAPAPQPVTQDPTARLLIASP